MSGIAMPDLVLESVIRDGLADIKANLVILDDVFSQLDKNYTTRKYGAAEIAKIKTYITDNEIAVVHSLHEANAPKVAYSISLGLDNEDVPRKHFGDLEGTTETPLDAAALAALVKVDPLTATAYDPLTGKVSVDSGIDLSSVYPGYIYEDGSAIEFVIQDGISEATNKFFFIAKNASPNIIVDGKIKSPITTELKEIRGVSSRIKLLIGVHSKEALITKYLYALLKYIIHSRRISAIDRGLDQVILEGSDFARNMAYEGDFVFTRFLTVNGYVCDGWDSDLVTQIDSAEIDLTPVDE